MVAHFVYINVVENRRTSIGHLHRGVTRHYTTV